MRPTISTTKGLTFEIKIQNYPQIITFYTKISNNSAIHLSESPKMPLPIKKH